MASRGAALNVDLLRRLCETPGIPGREERVRELILGEVEELFDDAFLDPMGNLVCHRKPRVKSGGSRKKSGKKKAGSGGSSSSSGGGLKVQEPTEDTTRVMMAAHMDEIGFYVKHITEEGFLMLNPAGGFDPRNLFSRRVLVVAESGDFVGVMNPGGRPIHISSQEERSKVPEVKEFFVDTGLDAKKSKETFRVGDFVVMHEPLEEMGDKVVSKALDNRFACWVAIECVRRLEEARVAHACELFVAFTVQEEVGLRGARTASNTVQPDIGIGLDVSLSCDTPGVPKEEAVTRQGEGVGLHVMDSSFIADKQLVDEMEAVAKKHAIPYQRAILARGGQDGAAMQQAMSGARAMGIVCGTRYIHTVTEMIDKRDLAAARDLLAAWVPTVE
jgi:endoglucanase